MRIFDFEQVSQLKITPAECVDWVRNAFLLKESSYLPPKFSLKLDNSIFFNTMPCYIPERGIFGAKVVSRYPEHNPSIESYISIFNVKSGEFLGLMDGNWITAMRTGAVASLAIQTLEMPNANIYSLLGLGNTARATILCLLNTRPDKKFHIRILKYKEQADIFIDRFKDSNNVEFEIVDSNEALIVGADVIISCITSADTNIGENQWFKKGVLVVPVHTKGFQNCDLFFDRVIADDTEHVRGFKYFSHFKNFTELNKILSGEKTGRLNSKERILSYNIGIALHDIYFASMIYNRIESMDLDLLKCPHEKFWV